MVNPLSTSRPALHHDQTEKAERDVELLGPPALAPTQDLAAYLAHMTAEMSAMARAAGYDLLAYFLDMARIEAKIQSDQQRK